MGEKSFTPDEKAVLQRCPYVETVTARQVRFTADFKSLFWREYEAGKNPSAIIRELGIDPGILGESRIAGIRMHIQAQAKLENGFISKRKYNPESFTANRTKTPVDRIARLEHELHIPGRN